LVVHSWRERLRKPEPEIYRLTLSRLGIEAKQAVFLDDIGGNLRVARQLGLTTIKVDDPADAIGNLLEIFPDL
ncbi:MAG TPA: HAD-IA family hydrolase, partial [Acidimicrobiia bacterium]|nr:HAD-IA family hydrolase [Acidimicrobiia bacterium]